MYFSTGVIFRLDLMVQQMEAEHWLTANAIGHLESPRKMSPALCVYSNREAFLTKSYRSWQAVIVEPCQF